MFCKKCGTEIIEGAKFCASCGCKINDEKIPRSMNEDGKILLVAEPQPKWCFFMMIMAIIMGSISGILLFGALCTQNSVFSSAEIVADRNLRIVWSLFGIGVAIYSFYIGMKWAAMKITICENAVYGSYGYGISKQFKFTYDDIISVSGGNNFVNVIIIVTKAKSYTLVHMEHASEAVKMIRDRINVSS